MPQVAMISLDENALGSNAKANQEFRTLPFASKLAKVKQHIESIAKLPNTSDVQIVTMREYMLGRPISPSENKAFKDTMMELTQQYPNLVIIGNTPTVRNYKVKNGTQWGVDANNAIDHEDSLDKEPDLEQIKELYNSSYHLEHEVTESGDNTCIKENRSFVTNLQESLKHTSQTVNVGIMKNNTYVFQQGSYQHHTKKAPIDELSGTTFLNEGQVYFMPAIAKDQLNDLDSLKEQVPSLGGVKDQMFMMNDTMYLWSAGQKEPPTEVIRTNENAIHYDALKEKLLIPPAQGTSFTPSGYKDLALIQAVAGKSYESNVQVFCPGSPDSKSVFSIKTPAMAEPVTLGIDTCREYTKATLRNSGVPAPDIHLVISDGMTFNARPDDNLLSSNHGEFLVVNDSKQPLQMNHIKPGAKQGLVVVGYQDNLLSQDMALSEPIAPKVNFFTTETLATLNDLDKYVNEAIKAKPDPNLTLIKTNMSSLYEAGYTSGNNTAAYKQLYDIIKKSPFTPLTTEDSFIAQKVKTLHQDINNNFGCFKSFIVALDEIEKKTDSHEKNGNTEAAQAAKMLHGSLSTAFDELNKSKIETPEKFKQFNKTCEGALLEAENSALKDNRGFFSFIRNALNAIKNTLCPSDSMNKIKDLKQSLLNFKQERQQELTPAQEEAQESTISKTI